MSNILKNRNVQIGLGVVVVLLIIGYFTNWFGMGTKGLGSGTGDEDTVGRRALTGQVNGETRPNNLRNYYCTGYNTNGNCTKCFKSNVPGRNSEQVDTSFCKDA